MPAATRLWTTAHAGAVMETLDLGQLLQQRSAFAIQSRQVSVFAVGGVFMALTLVVVGLRLWIRVRLLHSLGLDDTFAVLAMVFNFGLSIATMTSALYGTGRHMSQVVEADNVVQYYKVIYATRILYSCAVLFIKLSLLVFYLRLDPRPKFRIAVYIIIVIVVGLSIAAIFTVMLPCIPVQKYWDTEVDGWCMKVVHQQQFDDAASYLNIITNVFIYAFPIPMIWSTQMNMRRKLVTCSIFCVGTVSVGASCLRAVYLHNLAVSSDQSYHLARALNWCQIEVYLAIICASAPTFNVYMRQRMPRLLGSNGPHDRVYESSSTSINRHNMQTIIGSAAAAAAAGGTTSTQSQLHRSNSTARIGRCRLNESQEMIIPEGKVMTKMTKTEIRLANVEPRDVEEAAVGSNRPAHDERVTIGRLRRSHSQRRK